MCIDQKELRAELKARRIVMLLSAGTWLVLGFACGRVYSKLTDPPAPVVIRAVINRPVPPTTEKTE